jgi:HAT1-interacting factor 1
VEELKTTPSEQQLSAPALAAQELERELNAGVLRPKELPVNDLTSMVVKKKKKPAAEESSKRKAEEDRAASPPEKRAKVEEEETTNT